MSADQPPTWWTDDATLASVTRDLVAETWRQLRPATAPPPVLRAEAPPPSPEDLARVAVDERGLGADSLERIQLATAVATFFRLYETGVEELLLAKRTLGEWGSLIRYSRGRDDTTLGFTTGGTTGEPKVIHHAVADLWAEAGALAELCRDRTRVVGVVPRHHIYGFIWTVLLPHALDVPFADLRGGTPAGLGNKLAPGDLVVAIPDIWRMIAHDAPSWPANVDGVTATAPMPGEVARAASRRAVRRLIEIHGATETGGMGWRDDPTVPYTLLPHWDGASGDGTLTRTRPRGNRVTVTPPDHLAWHDNRRYQPAGRRDGAVQIAGTNVDPEQVRATLREHPEVADAAVRPMQAGEGTRLKAFVVPADGNGDDELAARVLDHAARHLPDPARPKDVRVGRRVPRTAMGKLADWRVSAAESDPS